MIGLHPGEVEARRRAGIFSEAAPVGGEILEVASEFLAEQSAVFLGFADPDDATWATVVTGSAGFVETLDRHTLLVSTGPLEKHPLLRHLSVGRRVGTLTVDFRTRDRVRINGVVESVLDDAFIVLVEEAFSNCRKYVQIRRPPSRRVGELTQVGVGIDHQFRAAVAGSDTLFLATGNQTHGFDVSHRGGRPGFLRWDGDTLVIPDYRGNRLFQTIGNLLIDPRLGLLTIDFATGRQHHGTGRASIVWEPNGQPGVERQLRIELDTAIGWFASVDWSPDVEPSPHLPPPE